MTRFRHAAPMFIDIDNYAQALTPVRLGQLSAEDEQRRDERLWALSLRRRRHNDGTRAMMHVVYRFDQRALAAFSVVIDLSWHREGPDIFPEAHSEQRDKVAFARDLVAYVRLADGFGLPAGTGRSQSMCRGGPDLRIVSNPPDAGALMMSARSFGNYDLPSALADLIDNSIKAKARSVHITCLRTDTEIEVRVRDDGEGMSAATLFAAMRPASSNPELERSPDDLGRFGWGLKSASFSQCRLLTVLSTVVGERSGAEWDLDAIDGWSMATFDGGEIEELAHPDLLAAPGTEVIWRKCDRLSENGRIGAEAFNELITHARARLALLYHRYLSGEADARAFIIRLNGQAIAPFDPFHRDNNATQPIGPETIHLPDGSSITIKGYILPHFSKLAMLDYDRLGGEEGFVRNQGFYIYRNDRLIMNGTWFRLLRHGELSQLVRVSVDIPNSLDEMWKITVDKADAQLPSMLRARLKSLVSNLRRGSGNAFRSRGGRIASRGSTPVWSKYARNGQIRYYVNRDHPLVASLLEDEVDPARGRAAAAAISIIEQQFPSITIGEDVVRAPEAMSQSEFDAHGFLETLDAALPALLAQAGSMDRLMVLLDATEPWAAHGPLVRSHLQAKGWINAPRK